MSSPNDYIERTNSTLEEKLSNLKRTIDPKLLGGLAQEINDLLYEVILNHPTEANAVQISTIISPKREEKGLPYAHTIFSGRYKLEMFLSAALGTKELHDTVEFEFVKHLPYFFTTGTHGSGERAAMGCSCPNLLVETGLEDNDVPAYLMIDVADQGFMQQSIHLFLDEIKSVKLAQVPNDKFTSVVDRPGRDKYTLKTSSSSVSHYLWYRGFNFSTPNAGSNLPKKWREEISATLRNVMVPEHSTGLFEDYWRILSANPTSFSGYAALEVKEEDPVLYKFNKFSIPRAFREEERQVVVAYALVKHGKHLQSNIQTYRGIEVVRELSRLEVKQTF
ncbi:MAG: hypothetical protein WCV90_01515 [Candidatus Woesearchaeota archaeon]|jgi:hypothetical protein